MEIMTPQNPNWIEFTEKLSERLNFQPHSESGFAWDCDSSDHSKPKAREVLEEMGFNKEQISKSMEYFEECGGGCDCEILFNVEKEDEEEG